MKTEQKPSESYNEYINGSKFRFLPFEELKKKHVIITDIKNNQEYQIIRKFFNAKNGKSHDIIGRREPLFYERFRPIAENNKPYQTFARQEIIKEMCLPNNYGIPDMLFKYEEFFNHYIQPRDNRV